MIQNKIISVDEIKMKHPFTAILAGPTACGKTTFIQKLLKHVKEMVTPLPERIVYCYSIWQDKFKEFLLDNPSIEFREGIINIDEIHKDIRSLVILDDLMNESKDDVNVSNLFTKGSHHKNMSIIFMSQNLFIQGKHMRSISLNSHYLVVFKNPRDKAQFSCLARQMYPKNQKFLDECFEEATLRPYGYLFIDLKQSTRDDLRIRTDIFPNEQNIVYVLKN
jgi:hypothetical protein